MGSTDIALSSRIFGPPVQEICPQATVAVSATSWSTLSFRNSVATIDVTNATPATANPNSNANIIVHTCCPTVTQQFNKAICSAVLTVLRAVCSHATVTVASLLFDSDASSSGLSFRNKVAIPDVTKATPATEKPISKALSNST